jgi:hypothetical protein
VGHHGSHGTTAAAMVHCVLSSYVSFVRELYVKYTFPPNKIFYCSRAKNPTRSLGGSILSGSADLRSAAQFSTTPFLSWSEF